MAATGLNKVVVRAHATANEKGWWDDGDWNLPEKLMLIVTEVAEAMECYRDSTKSKGLESELADIVIRVADLCGKLGIDLDRAVREKMDYNETRPYRHGGKRA